MTTRIKICKYPQDCDGSVTIELEQNGVWQSRIYAEPGDPESIGDDPCMVIKNIRSGKEFLFEYNEETEKYEYDLGGAIITVPGIRVIA